MTEIKTQCLLDIKIEKMKCKEFMFYSIFNNNKLKEIFKNSSKNNTDNFGNPDRFILKDDTLIFFECKSEKSGLINAIKDINLYFDKIIKINEIKNYFGVAFISETEFKIFKEKKEIKFPLEFSTFFNSNNLEIKKYSKLNMEKFCSKFHNIIRDNTRIDNIDKSFFICAILLSLQDENFRNLLNNDILELNGNNFANIMISIINNLGLNTEYFEFLRIHFDNDSLYKLSKMIYTELPENIDIDIINIFYSEFVKYQNSDSTTRGIVMTRDYIAKLIINLMKINNNDIVLDLCTGTGTFLMKSLKYNPKKLIGCELDTRLYTLFKCNILLRNKDQIFETYNDNCFNNNFKATKSIINPPYGMDVNTELQFILKQLECLEDNGTGCAIIPSTCINNTKFLKLKEKILEIGTILCVINLNKNVFYPSAAVQCCLIFFMKKKYNNEKVLFINYENDETKIQKHVGLIKLSNFKNKLKEIKTIYKERKETDISILSEIKINDDWNFHYFSKCKSFELTTKELKIKYIELQTFKEKYNLEHNLENKKISLQKFKICKIIDIFDIITIKRTTKRDAENNNGIYPYISSSEFNNGTTTMTNKMTSNSGNLTLANCGSVGSCFYQPFNFCGTDSIYVLELKEKYSIYKNNEKIGIYLSCIIEKLKYRYSFGRAMRMNKLIYEFIQLPVNENEDIDWHFIENSF